ncbi:MAG: hypothetical protein JWM56_1120 [Candidatus Peribacteria bacterium]|nr:hypothetical protein [Candidatus Peribacteria bacterium]
MEIGDMILETFAAMSDEEKERCIHCGTEWYKIHHRDGVCHRCQQESKPGRKQLAARATAKRRLMIGLLAVAALLILYCCLTRQS